MMAALKRMYGSLPSRVVAFLTLALLPIGLIAVIQTRELSTESRARLDLSLQSATALAAAEERSTILRAVGAAEAMSFVLPPLQATRADCFEYLQNFLEVSASFSFVGYVNADGNMSCSSTERVINFQENEVYKKIVANPEKSIFLRENGRVSGEMVIIAVHPVFTKDVFNGYVVVSMPEANFPDTFDLSVALVPDDIITFNKATDILTSHTPRDEANKLLPQSIALKNFFGTAPVTFAGLDQNGIERVYSVVPVADDLVYALGVWDASAPFVYEATFNVGAGVFPILMWLASLGVAFLSLHWFVLRHITRIRRKMKRFASKRDLDWEGTKLPSDTSREFVEMENDFDQMARSLLQDEAALEGALREKNILLKEVHHRVKNNLQLISSIMNMHIRRAKASETKFILRRLQDRVQGLATVHKNLYLAKDFGHLDAGLLVQEVVDQLMIIGSSTERPIDFVKDIDTVVLYPEQAVPLSLLASEAITNAIKYASADGSEKPVIKVHLKNLPDNTVLLTVSNTKGDTLPVDDLDVDSTGVGAKLIQSFARQLGSVFEIKETDDYYAVEAKFEITEFSVDAIDY